LIWKTKSWSVQMNYNENLPELDELDKKMLDIFPDIVVRKSYATDSSVFSLLPRYICEFLINRHQDDQGLIHEDAIKEIEGDIRKYCPEERDREQILRKIVDLQRIQIIDHFKVYVDLNSKKYRTYINRLHRKATVDKYLIQPMKYPELLRGGLWGKATVEYVNTGDSAKLNICDFEPYQTTTVVLSRYIAKRAEFTSDEWIDFLLRTIGLNPSAFSRRSKFLYLCRIIPLVESRVNFIEMGPPGTGKSYIYENISSYSRLILGGDVSIATLIYNASTKEGGLVFQKDVIVFDEINKIKGNKRDMVSRLQQIMASGHVERGDLDSITDVSFVFQGNLDTIEREGRIEPQHDDHFINLPNEMKDSPFLDRIHAYIHGWEFNRVEAGQLNRNLGMISNYFAEVLHQFRRVNFNLEIGKRIRLISKDLEGNKKGISLRDKVAIYHVISGYLKLIYPNLVLTDDEWKEIVNLSVELRQNVIDEIRKIEPGIFSKTLGVEWVEPLDELEEQITVSAEDQEREDDSYAGIGVSLLIYTNGECLLTRTIPYWILKTLVDNEAITVELMEVKQKKYTSKFDINKEQFCKIDRNRLKNLPLRIITEEAEPIKKDIDYEQDFMKYEELLLPRIQKRINSVINNIKEYLQEIFNITVIIERLKLDSRDTSELSEEIRETKDSLINDVELLKIKQYRNFLETHLEFLLNSQKIQVNLSNYEKFPILQNSKEFMADLENENKLYQEKLDNFRKNLEPFLQKVPEILPDDHIKRKVLFKGQKFKLFAFDMNNFIVSFKNYGRYKGLKVSDLFQSIKKTIIPKNDNYMAFYYASKNYVRYVKETSDLPSDQNQWRIESFRKHNSGQYVDIDQNLTGEICAFIEKYYNKISEFHLCSGDKDLHITCDYARKYNIPIFVHVVHENNLSRELEELADETDILYQ